MSTENQATAAMNEPRRHHYVARFQLKRFADETGFLSVYDREKQEYLGLAPKDVAVETDLYSFVDGDGKKNRVVESAIMSSVDDPVRAILDKLDNGERLSDEERLELALFASFQMMRVPAMRDLLAEQIKKVGDAFTKFAYATPERVEALMRNYKEVTGEELDVKPENLIEALQSGQIRVNANPGMVLRFMVEFGFEYAPMLASLRWRILVAPENGCFILSDQPFAIVRPRDHNPEHGGVGLLTPGAVKYLPLTPRVCLEMGDRGAGFGFARIDRAFVRTINMNTAINSRRFVIGGSRVHLQSVVERAGAQEVQRQELSDVRVFERNENSQFIRLSSQPLAAFRDERMGGPPDNL